MPLEGESETLPSTFAQVAVVHPVSALISVSAQQFWWGLLS